MNIAKSVLFIMFFYCFSLSAQNTSITLSVEEAITSSCGDITDCNSKTVCYNVIAEPSENLIGYTIVGYNIWVSTTNGSSTDPVILPIVGSTTRSCSGYNSPDVVGNTGNIYSQAVTNDQGVGGVEPIAFVKGPNNILFNFCITYNSIEELKTATLLVGSDIVGITSELVSKLGGSVILDTDIIPGVLSINSENTSCLGSCENTPVISIKDLIAEDKNSDGVEKFNLTTKIEEILNGQSGLEVNFYTGEDDARMDENRISNPKAFRNKSNPQTIYAGVQNEQGCRTVAQFKLVVNPKVKLYPNPGVNKVNIKSKLLVSKTNVEVYTSTGIRVLSFTIVPHNNRISMDISSLPTGVYFVEIYVLETGVRIIKTLKKN